MKKMISGAAIVAAAVLMSGCGGSSGVPDDGVVVDVPDVVWMSLGDARDTLDEAGFESVVSGENGDPSDSWTVIAQNTDDNVVYLEVDDADFQDSIATASFERALKSLFGIGDDQEWSSADTDLPAWVRLVKETKVSGSTATVSLDVSGRSDLPRP